jgi:hypothetical protein
MKTRERNQVDGELSEVRVELTRETKAASDARHDGGDQVIEISIGGRSELEGTEANVVESFVINAHDGVSVLDKLMDGKSGVVGFDNGIGDLW